MADGLWDQIKGSWKQVKGAAKQEWGDLTDDDLTYIEGSSDRLEGKLQERYGYAKEQAQQKISEWTHKLNMDDYREDETRRNA
jgi:uncharacterized protein YjbJ (UPF0337 family)